MGLSIIADEEAMSGIKGLVKLEFFCGCLIVGKGSTEASIQQVLAIKHRN
jgi:hypothetical protein